MRRQAREIAFQIIFESLFNENELSFVEICDEESLSKEDAIFVKQLITCFKEHKSQFKEDLSSILENGYDISMIYRVDFAIIACAWCEKKQLDLTPLSIVINEAVDIAKKFGTEKSYSFINAILKKLLV